MSITDSLVAAMRTDHGVSLSSAPTNRDMWREPVELAKQRLDHPALMDRATIAKPDTNAPVIKAALKRDPLSNPFRLTDTKIE